VLREWGRRGSPGTLRLDSYRHNEEAQAAEQRKQDLQALEQRMLLRCFAKVEARIDRVVVRLGSLIVVLTDLLFEALHYWPPHG
jgi:hypothetical protein